MPVMQQIAAMRMYLRTLRADWTRAYKAGSDLRKRRISPFVEGLRYRRSSSAYELMEVAAECLNRILLEVDLPPSTNTTPAKDRDRRAPPVHCVLKKEWQHEARDEEKLPVPKESQHHARKGERGGIHLEKALHVPLLIELLDATRERLFPFRRRGQYSRTSFFLDLLIHRLAGMPLDAVSEVHTPESRGRGAPDCTLERASTVAPGLCGFAAAPIPS